MPQISSPKELTLCDAQIEYKQKSRELESEPQSLTKVVETSWPRTIRPKWQLLEVEPFRAEICQPPRQRSTVNGSKAMFLALFIAVVNFR